METLVYSTIEENKKNIITSSVEDNTNTFQTFLNCLKCNVGTGILIIPHAIAQSGTVLGPISILCIGILITHSMLIILESNRELLIRNQKPVLGYAGTVKYSLLPWLGPKAKYSVYVTNFMILLSSFGGLSAYLVFSASTLQEITNNFIDDIRLWILIICGPLLILSLISRLETISIISGCAVTLCLTGLLMLFYFIFLNIKNNITKPFIGDFKLLPMSISTFTFAFEGAPTVIAVTNKLRNKNSYFYPVVFSHGLAMFLYIIIGLFGYMAIGSIVQPSITSNLPKTTFYNCFKILYALGVLLTYLIIMFVITSIVFPTIKSYFSLTGFKSEAVVFFIRIIILIITIIISTQIPHLDSIASLVGAISASSLSLIGPPIVHLLTFYFYAEDDRKMSLVYVIKDFIILALGIVISISGLYSTILDLIHKK